jgi:hypothetical protein
MSVHLGNQKRREKRGTVGRKPGRFEESLKTKLRLRLGVRDDATLGLPHWAEQEIGPQGPAVGLELEPPIGANCCHFKEAQAFGPLGCATGHLGARLLKTRLDDG